MLCRTGRFGLCGAPFGAGSLSGEVPVGEPVLGAPRGEDRLGGEQRSAGPFGPNPLTGLESIDTLAPATYTCEYHDTYDRWRTHTRLAAATAL